LNSTQEAVSSSPIAKSLPAGDQSWTSVEMLNSPGPNAYPIASFTYLLYKDVSNNPNVDQTKAKYLVDFISWAITDRQKFASKLGYVPLPPVVVKHDQGYTKVADIQRKLSPYRTVNKTRRIESSLVSLPFLLLC
jgi:phosphate transport system substrate-binding protein